MVTVGALILAFLAYQLIGTNLVKLLSKNGLRGPSADR